MCSFVPWTELSPPSAPPRGALRMATLRAPRAWFAARVPRGGTRRTYTTPLTSSRTTALGSAFGSREHINARAWESVRAFDEMRSAIGSVGHSPTEMVLSRQCADVSKLMYHTRISGTCWTRTSWSLLTDSCGPLSALRSMDHSWWQATTGPPRRWASRSPHPSPAASCAALCLVSTVVDHFKPRLRRPEPAHHGRVRVRTDAALARLVATLPPNAAQLHREQLDEALAERELTWRNVRSGEEAMQDQPTPSLWHARGITPDDGDGDDQHSLARKRLKIEALISLAWTRACIQACSRCMSRRANGRLACDCRNLGTLRSTIRGCGV